MTGGFFVTNLPAWIFWIKYLSYILYALDTLYIIDFSSAKIT